MDKIPIKVLLVEDNPTDVILLREALGQDALNTFELTVVERLDSALTTVQKNTFDIVLLDLGLPDSQGLETFNQIHQSVPEIPKVILSGLSDEALALQAVHAGAQDYEAKGTAGFASAARAIRYAVERQKAQTAVRASEERFRAMIENGLDDISLLDAKGNLIWESPSVVRNLGYAEHEFLQRSMFELIHPDDQAWTGALFTKLTNEPGTSQRGTFRLRHADGSWHWVEAVVTNLLGNPSVQAIVANYRDITDRKQAEETIRSLAKFPEENPNPILRIGREGQIIYANHIANHLWLGAWGASLNDPLPEEWQVLVVDAYQRNTKQALDMSIQGHIYAISIVPFPEYGYTNVYGDDVTESRQADEKVRTARKFLQGAQNALSAHISILDADGNIVQVNSAWREFADQNGLVHLNYEIGLNYLEICDSAAGADADEAPLVAKAVREILAGKMEQAQIEYPCHSPAEQRWFLLQITSFKDGENKFVVLAHENITERKLAENRIQESQTRLAEAQSMAKVGSWETDLPTLQVVWSDETYRIFELDTHTFGESHLAFLDFVHPEDRKQVDDAFASSLKNDAYTMIEHRIITARGNIKFVEERWRVEPDAQGRPVRAVGTCQDITERRQAEQKLLESEQEFRRLAEAMPQIVWITRADGWNIYFNQQWVDYTGLTLEESYGNGWNKPFHPDDQQRALDAWQNATKNGGIYSLDCRLRRADGNYQWWLIRGVPVLDASGTVLKWFGTCTDINERKLAEDQLRKLSRAVEQSASTIVITDKAGNIEYVNPKFTETTGYTPEDAYGENPRILKSGHATQAEYERMWLAITTGKEWHGELQNRKKNGELYWESATISPIFDEQGKTTHFIAVKEDITERKQTENKLREVNERFQQLADNIQEVFWITDAVTGEELYISPAGEKIWGHSIPDLMQIPDIFINTVLPEDRSMVLLTMEGQMKGLDTEMEYRIVHPDGSVHWIWDRAFPIFDEAGSVMRVAGIAMDITERKQIDAALQARDALLREAQRIAQLGHYQFDISTGFWESSDILNAVFGIDNAYRKDMNGWASLIHPIQRDEILANFKTDVVEKHKPFDREYQIVRNDNGQTRWVHGLGQLEFDSTGNPVRLIGTVQDITARKQTEAEASRHLAELQALYENGLAVGRLLEPQEIGERIIATFEKHLAWHHVAVRLIKPESMEMELVAFSQIGLNDEANQDAQRHLNALISTVGQGLSGWVAQTGQPFRTGNVNAQTQYIATYLEINSGLYMPLKLGERCIGVISVESHEPDAFSEQDERLLATLANQAAIAFENARLYQVLQQELQERMRAEIALRTSETHYRELTDSITDVFFELDQNLCYTHWNKASELLTGIPEVSALGRSMHEVMGVSEEQTRIEKIYESVLLTQHPTTFETHFNFNNLISAIEVNAYPSTRGVAVVAKDVTERKRSEIILQKRFELMEYAARHTLTEIMQKTIDEVSDLTGSNIGFFQTLQADQTSPGMQIWSTKTLSRFNVPISEGQHQVVEHAGVWADAIRQRRALIHNDYGSLPNKKVLPTGHAPLSREIVIPIIRNGNILAVMGIANKPAEYTQQDLEIAERFTDYAWDITERKQMELALAEERNQLALRVEERTADFSRANANLARALRVKDEFLANMSHELRTPLNAILGLSESLAEQTAGPLNEKQLRYITTVTESGHHLLSLINDILDLAKIEAGQITLDVNKVDIHSVCEASLRMIKQLARKKNQETFLQIDPSIGLMWADERRLKQMLVNLLSNAVKFTPNDGKLGLEVHGDRDANKVTFTIWDTGIGIKEADLLRLFQPFVQLDAGLARESSGTGLGLALVAQMARLHGGGTSVVSEPGKGSRFTIMLPWEQVLVLDAVEKLKITGKFRPIKFSKERKPIILLVEDTEDVIMMISDYLELNGFKVYTARDGIEGVTQAQLIHPDLILMDIQMPRMDGFEATQKLRSEPDFKKTPIIALTALAMPNDRERCLEAGMDEYITKPVHLRALVKLIENFLTGEQEVQPK